MDPPIVRIQMRALPESVFRTYLGADGYTDLEPFLDINERTCCDDLATRQLERLVSLRSDWSPTLERLGDDYLCIHPESGEVVDQWSANRKRREMYAGDTPFLDVSAYRARG